MRKGLIIFTIICAFIFTLLYAVPLLVNFNNYKDKFAAEFEKTFGFPVRIDGDIGMSLLPRAYVFAKNVKIFKPVEVNAGMVATDQVKIEISSVEDFYIEVSFMDLFNLEKLDINKVILSGLKLDIKENDLEMMRGEFAKITQGDLFNKIQVLYLKDSNIKYFNKGAGKQEDLQDIDMSIMKNNSQQNSYDLSGKITIRNIDFEVEALAMFNSLDSYDLNLKLNKHVLGNELNIDLKASKRAETLNMTGNFDVKANKFDSFARTIVDKIPNTGITEGTTKLSGNIKYTQKILYLEDLKFVNGNTFGTGTLTYDLKTNQKTLNTNFTYLEMKEAKIDSAESITNMLKKLAHSLYDVNINMTVESFVSGNKKARNIKINTSALSEKDKLKINTFSLNSADFSGSITGDIAFISDEMNLALKIISDTNISKKFPPLKNMEINQLNGFFNGTLNNFTFSDAVIHTNAGDITGTITLNKTNGKTYIVDLTSTDLNLDILLYDNVFNVIKNKSQIGFLKDASIDFKINSANITYKKEKMKNFSLSGLLTGDTLTLNNLDWIRDDYVLSIKGGLKNIYSNNGEFENILYEVKAYDFSNVAFVYLDIPFLQELLKNESGTITFTLNGPAINPKIKLTGKFTNMDLSADILSPKRESLNINLNLNYKDAKTFAFKVYQGQHDLIGKTMKDNVPLSFSTNLINDQNNNLIFDQIKGKLGSNELKGKIIIDKSGIVNADFTSQIIDLTNIIKNSSDNYKYNATIYILNHTKANINISTEKLISYTREYSNVAFGINRSRPSNPSFTIKGTYDGDSYVDITGNVSGNSYTGTATLQNIVLETSVFGTENFDILSGIMNATFQFSTSGENKENIIHNLSGPVKADFYKGMLSGISSKQDMNKRIYSQPTIITNMVVESIEGSLRAGVSPYEKVSINGTLQTGVIRDGSLNIEMKDILVSGQLRTADLKTKALQFVGNAQISNILEEPLHSTYIVEGFAQNLVKEVVLENIIAKLNPTYLQVKKNEYIANKKREEAEMKRQEYEQQMQQNKEPAIQEQYEEPATEDTTNTEDINNTNEMQNYEEPEQQQETPENMTESEVIEAEHAYQNEEENYPNEEGYQSEENKVYNIEQGLSIQ